MADQAKFAPLDLAEAKRRYDDAKQARRPFEPEWFMNLAFFQGDQWCAWNGGSLYKPRVRSRVTMTDNRVRPAVLTEVARLSKQRPGWATSPRQLDDQSVQDALASKRLLEWLWDKLGMPSTRREALMWARIVGASFIKTCWDPTKTPGVAAVIGPDGQPIPHPTTGAPLRVGEMPAVEGMDGVTTKQIGGGEIVHHVRSAFDLFPDPLATTLADARWIIDESVRSPEYVKAQYGLDVAPDASSNVGIVESRYSSSAVDSARGKKTGIKVFEMWEPPSAANPDGRRMVWHNAGILFQGPNEYKRIPYTMFVGTPVPGRFWPDSTVTDMRPIQVRLNKLLSQIAENLSRFGNPSLLLDALSNITYTGVPGEQIKHNATTAQALPQFLQPPSMPGQTESFIAHLEDSLSKVGAANEVSQGTVPPGVTAASAISLLQEQGDTRIGPDVEAAELALADVGQQTLDLAADYYSTERILVILGDDGVIDVDTFKANAQFNVPNVSVEPMSTFPRSLAARQAATRDLLNMFLQYGVPIDQAALPKLLRNMQVGGVDQLVATYSADVTQVNRENAEFLRGADIQVRKFDNDDIHIRSHEDWAKSARFLTLDPVRQAAYLNHIDMHRLSKQQKAQEAALAAIPPPPPGAGSTVPGTTPPPLGTVSTSPSGDPMSATPDQQIDGVPSM